MKWTLKEYKRLASTQTTAERLAKKGATEGTVILGERQTAGRGRFGRRWASPKGGLYMSLVLRPTRLDSPHLLTLMGALSVVEGVKSAKGVDSGIRWPNDVMIMGRKVAGVVGAANYTGPAADYAILGIGVNCNVPARSLGETVQPSTSLSETLGSRVEIKTIRNRVLDAFARVYSSWREGADEEILRRVASVLTTVGREVQFKRFGLGPQTGIARALSEDGSLLVEVGRRAIRLRAEGVEWLREK